jgi:hypothetical protein
MRIGTMLVVGALCTVAGSPLLAPETGTRSGEYELVPLPASTHHRVDHAPRIKDANGSSTNWSGYSVTNQGSVDDVVGTWVVPTVTTSSTNAWSSSWVGIDGDGSSSVEQLGTDQDCSSGTAVYYAWFEMYPKPSYLISGFNVHPGDTITARVHRSWTSYTLSMKNVTTGQVFSTTQKSGKAQNYSAEWIMEAPWSGGVLPLANFGTIEFSACSATISGTTHAIGGWANIDDITMVNSSGGKKAQPSNLNAAGDGFSVTWYGQ